MKTKFKPLSIAVILIILALMILKVPMCYFPEEEIDVREPTKSDIRITERNLDEYGYVNKYLVGTSMYPALKPGQVCICKKTNNYQPKDIISYYIEDNNEVIFIMHRIMEILPSGYITKGDNNIKIDPFIVEEEQIFCEVEQVSYMEYLLRGGKFG